jgi:co-chaperonin GroES (HSP10)
VNTARNRPLIAAAALGLAVTFGAGWAVGHGGGASQADVATPQATLLQTPLADSASPAPSETSSGSGDSEDPANDVGAAARTAKLPALTKWKKPPIEAFTCPAATVTASTSDQLQKALNTARAGASIRIADGLYTGEFRTTRDGSAKKPIYLCGSRNAVLEAGAIKGGYTLHFDGASYWRVNGFTVRNGQKGVMVDAGQGIGLQNLLVEHIGDEAVHLRTGSTQNVVRGLTIRDTGNRKPQYGEGVYIGTAESNWCEYTKCKPDLSNGNFVLGNTISGTTAESVDIKEGTSGGVLTGNTFDGEAMTEGDSWVDVKGNGWLISGNTGTTSRADGYKVIEILDGWGWRNLFSANRSTVDGSGYAINVTKRHSGNVVRCNNTAVKAADGLTTIDCSK